MMDTQTIYQILLVVLAIVIGYLIPKHYRLKKAIKLSDKQKAEFLELADQIKEAVSDGVITPEEFNSLLEKISDLLLAENEEEMYAIIKEVVDKLVEKRKDGAFDDSM